MKELPYFRFTCQEWQNGDIALEDYELQGFFISFLSFYWVRNCEVTKDQALKRFSNARVLLERCLELEIIKIDFARDLLEVNFLDEQWKTLRKSSDKRSKAGKIGGLRKASNAKAMLKPGSSYKDKDKDKDNITPKSKHSFEKSPFYLKEKWLEALSDWPQNKALEYWDKADNYSGANGGKYLNWVKAVKNWERKENPQETNSQDQTNSRIMI